MGRGHRAPRWTPASAHLCRDVARRLEGRDGRGCGRRRRRTRDAGRRWGSVRSRATLALASVGDQCLLDEEPGGRSIGRVGHTAAVALQDPYSGTQQRINRLHVATPPATLSQHLQPDGAREKLRPRQFKGGQEHPQLRSCQPTGSTSQYQPCVFDDGHGIRRRQRPVTARWRPVWPHASALDARSPGPEPSSSPHRARGLAPPH